MPSQGKADDWINYGKSRRGIRHIEAFISGHGYDIHRHDTYAIGVTISGIQSFWYRGETRHSLPGRAMVLHPDEPHDGHAGSDAGFRYKMLYIEPSLIQQILGGRPLPFVKGGITDDPRLYKAVLSVLAFHDDGVHDWGEDESIVELSDALCGGAVGEGRVLIDYKAAEKVREFINEEKHQKINIEELANLYGKDRWQLSRDFRTLFGTSPYRYLTMRRLESVQACLLKGDSLTEAALFAGFVDQSHMSKQFKKTFGISPGLWLRMQGR